MEKNQIYCGDCRDLLREMPDGYVQTVITSPPYWSLRNYGLESVLWDGDSNCNHVWGEEQPAKHARQVSQSKWGKNTAIIEAQVAKRGQFCQTCGGWLGTLGLEPSPDLYVSHMVDIFSEIRRVLRADGTAWVNIGDTYYGSKGRSGSRGADYQNIRHKKGESLNSAAQTMGGRGEFKPSDRPHPVLKPKDLALIPERLAIALQTDGWWIRQIIVWEKGCAMPESARDRCTRSHEYILLMAKSERYYYDKEGISEPSVGIESYTGRRKRNPQAYNKADAKLSQYRGFHNIPAGKTYPRRNRRSVWHINPTPYPDAHFATFPAKLPEICILAGTSPRACERCGAPWERIVEKTGGSTGASWVDHEKDDTEGMSQKKIKAMYQYGRTYSVRTLRWQPTCECDNAGSARCLVLDPFVGSGTTAVVAANLGRDFVGFDASDAYVEMAKKRIQAEASNPVLPLYGGILE